MNERIEGHLFGEVAQLVRTLVPDGIGDVRTRAHRRGVKVWFDTETPTKEHYEAQVMPGRYADLDGAVLEIGFHAEHKDEAINQAVADRLSAEKQRWSPELGTPAQLDTFYGRDSWRRLSETWTDAEQLDDDPDAPFEIACRLVDYISVIEPIRTG